MATASGAHGEDRPPDGSVIELFTSQGCPKCPPADRLITDFAKDPKIIALSFAVNYWDYVGWKDTLASPIFTARQKAYAAARGDKLVFTPQAIVDGIAVEPGADRDAILRDSVKLAGQRAPAPVPLTLTESAGRLHIEIGPARAAGREPPDAGVYVLRVARSKTVQIGRGENSGRAITYTNVVRAIRKIGDWTGAPARFDLFELSGEEEGYVVLLQTGTLARPGAILAVAKTADL